jgi:hypothetical protein
MDDTRSNYLGEGPLSIMRTKYFTCISLGPPYLTTMLPRQTTCATQLVLLMFACDCKYRQHGKGQIPVKGEAVSSLRCSIVILIYN